MRPAAKALPCLIALLLASPSLCAQDPVAAVPDTSIDLLTDAADRMTVPVIVNGTETQEFMVDTGADRTVISLETTQRLGLAKGRPVIIHTMNGTSEVPTYVLPRFQVAGDTVQNARMPALLERTMGAQGILGVDSLQKKRVTIDLRKNEMTVTGATRAPVRDEPDTIVIVAKSRYGQLILVDAEIDGRRLNVVLDTGAQNTVGNAALRKMVMKTRKVSKPVPIELVGVTGERTPADYARIDRMTIGGFTVVNVPVAFAEVHPFSRFGLTRRPALLLGMDVLRMFDKVSIDFANRKIRFLIPRTPR